MLESQAESMAEHATYYMCWLLVYCVYSVHPGQTDIDVVQKSLLKRLLQCFRAHSCCEKLPCLYASVYVQACTSVRHVHVQLKVCV